MSKNRCLVKHENTKKITEEKQTEIHEEGFIVSWCFEPCQPLEVTSGLNTNSDLSLSYSAHKSSNINHNISTAQSFHTYIQNHTYLYKTTNFLHHR